MYANAVPNIWGDTIYGECNVKAYHEPYRRTISAWDVSGKEYEISKAPVVWEAKSKNVILDFGRKTILRGLFNISTITYFLFGCVGDSNVSPTDPSLDRLQNELITGGPASRPGITDSAGGALDASDVVSSVSGNNRFKIVVKYVYSTSDFNSETMAEFGLNDTSAFPGTPTSVSGIMLCRFVPNSSFVKSSSFSVSVEWTLRS